ncbi:hypothetical protein SK128_005013 [Halocaridina rubra]|uniref:Uncharacterized protein n=1 Tax=Halocaridina rubra TaxID=373956 RepID=A0AAN9A844_HALRR
MKSEGESDENAESVKRLAPSNTLLSNQIFVQSQQLTSVPIVPAATTGPLFSAPTAVAIPLSDQGTLGGEHCVLGSTVAYSQPNLHTPCNILLATTQPYVSAVPVSHLGNIASTCGNSSGNRSLYTYCHQGSPVVSSCTQLTPKSDSLVYSNAVTVENSSAYSHDNSQRQTYSLEADASLPHVTEVSKCVIKDFQKSKEGDSSVSKKSPSSKLANIVQSKRCNALRKSLAGRYHESAQERQARLSRKFNSLIRAKILELVRARGVKKTVCPSEVSIY